MWGVCVKNLNAHSGDVDSWPRPEFSREKQAWARNIIKRSFKSSPYTSNPAITLKNVVLALNLLDIILYIYSSVLVMMLLETCAEINYILKFSLICYFRWGKSWPVSCVPNLATSPSYFRSAISRIWSTAMCAWSVERCKCWRADPTLLSNPRGLSGKTILKKKSILEELLCYLLVVRFEWEAVFSRRVWDP